MINYKKYSFLFIMLCACLLITATTVSAEDVSNDTQTSSIITTQQTSMEGVVEKTDDNKKTIEKELKTTNKKSVSKQVKDSNTIAKNSKKSDTITTINENKTTINKKNKIANNTKSLKTTDITVSSYEELYNAINKSTTDNLNITLAQGDYSVTSKITIANDTLKTVTINGNNQAIIENSNSYSFLTINKGVTVYLNNITLRNAVKSYYYSINNYGTLSINNSVINAVVKSEEKLIINNSKFVGNSKYFDAFIRSGQGDLSLSNSVFINNTSPNKSELLYIGYGNSIISNCTFINNTGKNNFMSIYGNLTSTNNTYINNSGKNPSQWLSYGTIYCQGPSKGSSMIFINDKFINNTATSFGVIDISAGSNVTTINCSFSNSASANAGVIYNCGNYTSINSTFINNSATNTSGVVRTIGNYTSTNDVFINNSADKGGVIYQIYNSRIASNTLMTNATMINNKAATQGGLLYNEKGTILNITDSLIANNTAINGFLMYNLGNLTIKNNNFINNTNTDKEDILLINTTTGNTTATNNTYINNSLETSINATNQVTTSSNVKFDITVKIHEIYNQTVAGGKIGITVNSQLYSTATEYTIKDGKMTVEVPLNLLTQASNNITFTYSAVDNSYQSSNTSVIVKAATTKNNANITAQLPQTFTIGDTYQVNITLKDNKTNTPLSNQDITIKTETITTTVKTDSNGVATYQYTLNSNDKTFTIIYEGSDDYYGTTQSYNINADKLSTNLSISEVKSAKINDKIELNATLTDTDGKPLANKEIIFTINNQEYKTNTNEKGIATHAYTPTITTTVTVAVKYDGDNAYEGSTNTTQFTVEKIKTNLNIKTETVAKLNKTTTITITLTDENNAKLTDKDITIVINGTTITNKTNNQGIATVTYMPAAVGEYSIIATFSGDDNYISSTDSTKFTVNKLNTSIAVNNIGSVMIGSKTAIKVTLTDENGDKLTDKTITLTVGDDSTNIKTDNDGVATYEYTATVAGAKTIVAKYEGDSDYNGNQTTSTITVTSKKLTSLNIQAVDTKINKTTTITVTLSDEDSTKLSGKTVSITVDDETFTNTTDGNGVATFGYTPKSSGEFTVNAKFTEDDDYASSSSTAQFTVSKLNTSIVIGNDESVMIEHKTEIKVTLRDEDGKLLVGKTIILTVDGNSNNIVTDNEGIAYYNYTAGAVGEKTIVAKYDGEDDYNANQTTSTITVTSKKITKLDVQAVDTKINKTTTITVTLTDEDDNKLADKEVTLTINGTTFTNKTNSNGVTTFDYTPKQAGGYVVTVNFKEDSDYLASSSNSQFTAQKFNTSIVISNPDSIMVDHNAEIKVTLTDEDGTLLSGKTITLTVGEDSTNIKTDNYGVASYNYTFTSKGKKEITAKYEGDSDYNGNQTTSTITVTSKKTTSLDIQAVDTKINKTTTITVTLSDEDSAKLSDKTVTITVNGETFTNKTNNDGVATFEYTSKTSGEITVTAKFMGDDTYASSSNTAGFTVSKLATSLVIYDISSLKVNDTAVVTVTLTDEDQKALSNKEVSLTVNGTTLINTTNDKGIVVFNYVPVHAGKYTVNAVFTEDDSFLSSSSTAQFTVNKLDTSIVIVNDESVIIGGKSLIKVTLRDEDGKLLADKTVILTVDGISNSITTGSDGVASYNYTATSTGEKSITAKYDGEDDYNGNQTTSAITVTGKTVTNINVQAVDTKINKTTIITVTLTDGNNNKLAGKTVIITVNSETFTNKTNNAGIATFIYTPVSAGEYSVVAEFVEDDTFEGSENSTVFAVNKLSTVISTSVVNDTARNTVINVTLADENGNPIVGTVVVKDMSNVTLASGVTGSDGKVQIDLDLLAGGNSLTIVYDGGEAYLSSVTSLNVDVKRSDVEVDLQDYDMFIFDYSNITVNVTDEYGNPVNGGYVIFKVNGVTLKSNGKFYSQETNPMKFTVTNGKATIVFNATSFYNKKYVHSMIVKYSGTTSQYNSASSTTKTLSINKRIGYMTVTTDKTSYNLYETVNIKATYYDITHGNATPIYADGSCYAIYKINGVTSKVNGSDEKFAINNSQVLIGNNSKSQINYIHIDHTAPNKKEYHTIDVKTHNEYYTTLVGNTTITLNKSPTHIDINKVTYNKTSNKITISADIKDYKNNNTKGVNYYSVKINGITYKVNSQTTFNTTGGNIEITINSTTKNLRNIELVTREKLAYEGSRNTTDNINVVT